MIHYPLPDAALNADITITAAKRTLIHDHIDHCLGHGGENELAELRAMAKLL